MNSLYLILANKRYFAPAWVFASLNIILGTWALYIPRVKDKLAITDGQLGIALFCLGLGTLTALFFSSKIIKRIGVGRGTIFGILVLAILYILPLVVSSYVLLCCSLYFVGIASCFIDIAMNALVADIEEKDGVHIMSASHGFFSIGGAIAAGVGYFIVDWVTVPTLHMVIVATVVIVTNLILAKNYFYNVSPESEGSKVNLELLTPLFGLTLIAFVIMGSEGAIEQWSKLYLEDVVGVLSEGFAGLGFFVFSLCMALGRFFGDEVSQRFGALKVV